MSETQNSWPEANQRYLMARLQVVRLALERHVARVSLNQGDVDANLNAEQSEQSGFDEVSHLIDKAAAALPAPAALDHLCDAFSLSPFERDLLLLCAGVELNGDFHSLCASAQGDARRNYATFSLALAALPGAHWNALTPIAPLRRWRLIETAHSGEPLLQTQLRIDERVLHYLAGVSYLDERLKGLVTPFTSGRHLPPSQQRLAERVADFWARRNDSASLPVALLCGNDRAGKRN